MAIPKTISLDFYEKVCAWNHPSPRTLNPTKLTISKQLSIGSSSPILKLNPKSQNPSKTRRTICNLSTTESSSAASTTYGFETLMENFTVHVLRAESRELNVPLLAPFTIASSRLERVENVAIRVELIDGSVGWGESPVLPSVTAEDQPTAMAKASETCELLRKIPAMNLRQVLQELGRVLPGHEFASVRAGTEMALIDAVTKSIGVPLWRLFGGASNAITTDITIPIVSPAEAAEMASKYRRQGFKTLKLKVGKNLKADIEVFQAIRIAHPDCELILDANEGYKSNEAVEVLEILHEMRVTPILFEQPVHREDWEGLGHVTRVAKEKYGVSVAADESCRSLADLEKIVKGNLANVVNIKLAKSGTLGALKIIESARASGLDLMIGGMVETRLAMGFAGHLAAGLGCFKFIDLDTPLLLAEDPVLDCYEGSQMRTVMVDIFNGILLHEIQICLLRLLWDYKNFSETCVWERIKVSSSTD